LCVRMMIPELKAHAGHVTPEQSQFAAVGNERKQSVRKCEPECVRLTVVTWRQCELPFFFNRNEPEPPAVVVVFP
jgi:hypothetical protein